jgi:hypothetical protein
MAQEEAPAAETKERNERRIVLMREKARVEGRGGMGGETCRNIETSF